MPDRRRWMSNSLFMEPDKEYYNQESGAGAHDLKRPVVGAGIRDDQDRLIGVGPRTDRTVGSLWMPATRTAAARVPGADHTPIVGDYTNRTMDQASGFTRRMMDVPEAERGGAGADMADRNGNGIPDGAEVTRTITMQGPDGETDRTTIKYGASNTADRRKMMQPSLSGQDRLALSRGESMLNRDTRAGRAGGEIRRRMMDDVKGFNEALDRDAGRDTALGMEGIKAQGVIGAAEAAARGQGNWSGTGNRVYNRFTGETNDTPPAAGELAPGAEIPYGDGQTAFWDGKTMRDRKTMQEIENPQTGAKFDWMAYSMMNAHPELQKQYLNNFVAGTAPQQVGQAGAESAESGTIRMKFPDGSVKNVPAKERARWEGMGGKAQ